MHLLSHGKRLNNLRDTGESQRDDEAMRRTATRFVECAVLGESSLNFSSLSLVCVRGWIFCSGMPEERHARRKMVAR